MLFTTQRFLPLTHVNPATPVRQVAQKLSVRDERRILVTSLFPGLLRFFHETNCPAPAPARVRNLGTRTNTKGRSSICQYIEYKVEINLPIRRELGGVCPSFDYHPARPPPAAKRNRNTGTYKFNNIHRDLVADSKALPKSLTAFTPTSSTSTACMR